MGNWAFIVLLSIYGQVIQPTGTQPSYISRMTVTWCYIQKVDHLSGQLTQPDLVLVKYKVVLHDDGNLVMHLSDNRIWWSSGSNLVCQNGESVTNISFIS